VILLYLETNFLIGHAKYQDDASKLQEIVKENTGSLQIMEGPLIPQLWGTRGPSIIWRESRGCFSPQGWGAGGAI
jgi:hypothetical protein